LVARHVFSINQNSPKKISPRFQTGDMLHELSRPRRDFVLQEGKGRVLLGLGLVTSRGGRPANSCGVTVSARAGGVR
jgi:hypothetical protein